MKVDVASWPHEMTARGLTPWAEELETSSAQAMRYHAWKGGSFFIFTAPLQSEKVAGAALQCCDMCQIWAVPPEKEGAARSCALNTKMGFWGVDSHPSSRYWCLGQLQAQPSLASISSHRQQGTEACPRRGSQFWSMPSMCLIQRGTLQREAPHLQLTEVSGGSPGLMTLLWQSQWKSVLI